MRSASRLSALPTLTLVLAAPLAAQQRVVLPEKEQTLAGTPTDVFSVGKEEGESWEMLSNVQAVTFDRQNNLYVMDSGNFRVLVFDARGRFLRQIGKQGNGPGELTFPLGLALAPDGNIVVADMGRAGFAIFKPDGSYVKNVNAPEGNRPGGPGTGNVSVDATGAVIFRAALSIMAGGGGRAAMPDLENLKSPIIRTALTEGAKPTTLYEIPLPTPRVQQSGGGGGRQMRMVAFGNQMFAPPTAWAALPNGAIAVLHDPEYAIKIVDPTGKVSRIVARDEEPRKVTRRDQEKARDQRREQLKNPSGRGGMQVTNNNGQMSYSFSSGRGLTDAQIEEQLRNMTFANVIPLVQSLRSDQLGRLWVQRTGDEVGETGPVDLLASDGRYLGTLNGQKIPDAVSSTGLGAYIERDDLDVQRIAVRQLPPAWSAGLTPAAQRR